MPKAPAPSCACVKRHSPPVVVTDLHHVQPQSWGGKTVPENMIELCPSTHYTTHSLLNVYVRALPGQPDPKVVAAYPPFAQNLAKRAIAAAGGTAPHIYTVAPPGGHDA